MARSGGNAEMQIRMEELEEMEAAGAGTTRTAASSNVSVGGGSGGQHSQQQQPSPIPSTASTPTTRISQVAPFQGSWREDSTQGSTKEQGSSKDEPQPQTEAKKHGKRELGSVIRQAGLIGEERTHIPHIPRSYPLGAAAASPFVNQKPGNGGLSGNLWKLLFLSHLVVILILIIFLAVRGFLNQRRSFHPAHWFLPLLVAVACSVPTAVTWLVTAVCRPSKALRASLWLAPLMTCAISVFLFDTGTAVGLAFAVLGLVLALVQSLYACWVTPRLEYAGEILAASVSATQGVNGRITGFVSVALAAGLVWSGIWVLGVGGIAASGPRFSGLYIVMLLLTLAWTMQVLRNIVTVAVSGFAYIRLGRGANMDPGEAWRNAWTISLGSVCLGSAIVPVVGTLRDTARSMNLAAGDADEFLFSCANCYMGVADRLIAHGNRWGFVQVGVYAKGFVAASEDTWGSFVRLGMEPVIDADLTSSFCFLCGVAGGALSALIGGIWVLVVDRSYVTTVTLYAFIIGYFMNRIAMAWPQACVSALHVAYAENPQIPEQFGEPITNLIRSLRRS